MIELKGKTALITGSSRGVGQQIAMGLAKLGCNIILHGRTEKSCYNTISLLKKYPNKVNVVYGELSDKDQVDYLVEQLRNFEIDILYNNAAIMIPYQKNIWEHDWEAWLETFKVNVVSMYRLCGAIIPKMQERGFGRVINLTSRIDKEPELAPYGASKWAVDKLTDDLASKFTNTPIRINTLDPGWLRTDLGGEYASHPVEAVLPGALEPALIADDGPNGQFFSALNHGFSLEEKRALGY